MYPHHLYLKNFLSYGAKGIDIDFEPYQTVLLIGANGSGKSSILDAILWALWGKTRFGGDTDVMHSGSDDMEVRLDFVVHEHIYRIIRKRSKKGKSFVSVLELQSLTDPITVLTDATISKTQERINELISVDYDLLISSAFLRQGEANEFTHKSPTKRKELLSSILRLDQYQQWHEGSKMELKEIDNVLLSNHGQRDYLLAEKSRLGIESENITKELSNSDIPAIEQAIDTVKNQLTTKEKTLTSQREKLEQVKFWETAHNQTLAKIEATKKKITELSERQKINSSSSAVVPLKVDHARLAELGIVLENLQNIQAQKTATEEQLIYITRQLQDLAAQKESQISRLDSEITKLRNTPTLAQYQHVSLEASLEKNEKAKLLYEQETANLLTHSEKIAGIEQELQSTITQGNVIKDKRTKLEKLAHTCPLCEQDINDSHKKDIAEKYETERNSLLEHYNTLKTHKDSLEKERQEISHRLKALQEEINELNKLREIQVITDRLQSLESQRKELLLSFEKQEQALQETIKNTQEKIAHFGKQSAEYKGLKDEQRSLQEQDMLYRKHQEQALVLQGLQKEIELHQESLSHLEAEAHDFTIKIDHAKAEIVVDTGIEVEIQKLQTQSLELTQTYTSLLQKKNLLDHLQHELQRIENTMQEQDAKNSNLIKNRESLAILADALSYKGIPTMIIENAIPRLEQYANDILSFLSDNTMSIRFSLSRTSKVDRDNQIETLDILIGDTFGTRAYELFSGGEAFRIDIALRLALTKLLTERSKGTIDFLVIDEGFGSQDEGGRDHITQIIHKLEKYFKLIVIITHVDTLKDTFPDRLLVRKGPQGSEIIVDTED